MNLSYFLRRVLKEKCFEKFCALVYHSWFGMADHFVQVVLYWYNVLVHDLYTRVYMYFINLNSACYKTSIVHFLPLLRCVCLLCEGVKEFNLLREDTIH